MRPPADLPIELVLLAEMVGRRPGMPADELWDVLYRRKPAPSGWAEAWREAFYPLPSVSENATLATMAATQIAPARRGRPLAVPEHPFVAALVKANLTVAEIADELGRGESTVKAWYKDQNDRYFRPVPRAAAEHLRKRLKVPLSAWARIAG